jgi:hypothetical protein
MSNRRPPRKKAGVPTGPRRFDGEVVLDVAAVTQMLTGEPAGEEKKAGKVVRSRVARGLLPHRRWGGRIIFLRSEILTFLDKLPGVTSEQALENIAARNGQGPTQ